MRNDFAETAKYGCATCASFHVRWIDTRPGKALLALHFGPGVGVGTSVTRSTSLAGPVRSYIATRMIAPLPKVEGVES